MRAEIERLAVSASIHTLVTFRTSDCCFNNRVIIHQLALKNFVGFSFSMLENHKSSCVFFVNFCFVWFTDFLFAWSSLWRCFSVFYCIFITFNPLEAISCALSLCVQKRLLFAPAEPKFKTWIKPYGVGEDGHPVKPLAETMLNKAPETCTLALAMQKKKLSVIGGSTTHFSILRFIPVSCRI